MITPTPQRTPASTHAVRTDYLDFGTDAITPPAAPVISSDRRRQ
jgi:hypothetical protein